MLFTVILSIISYLIGSLNTSIIVSKKFYNADIRNLGSLNAGASNAVRSLGVKAGATVFLIDFIKGLMVVEAALICVAKFNAPYESALFAGFFAQVGHIFPVFFKFKGGKGVAVAAGAAMGIMPLTASVLLGCFVVILLITRTVSLASAICAAGYPLLAYFFSVENKTVNFIFAAACAVLITLKHSSNFIRLINGQEEKINFKKKRRNNNSE